MGGFETHDSVTKNSLGKCLGKVTDYRWLLRKGVLQKKRCFFSSGIFLMWLSVSLTFSYWNSSHFLWMFWLLISGPFSVLILNSIWLIQIQGMWLLKSFTIFWFQQNGAVNGVGFCQWGTVQTSFYTYSFHTRLTWHTASQSDNPALGV